MLDSDLVSEIDLNFYEDWWYIYRLLLSEGRIWEMRDILVAAVEAEGPYDVWDWLFGVDIDSDGALVKFLDDWAVQNYDESTYLAVLDTLVSVSTALTSDWVSPPTQQHIAAAKRFLQHASTIESSARTGLFAPTTVH